MTSFRSRSPIPHSAAKTELLANYIQEIIEAAIEVGRLSGYTPQYVLQGISEAIVDDKELDHLAKTWVSPPLPAAIIAIPTSGSGSNQPSNPAAGPGVNDASASAKGMKLTKILQASQDNRECCSAPSHQWVAYHDETEREPQ